MAGTDAPRGDAHAEWDQLGRKHIFVVNRDPAFLDLLRVLLQEERYNVTTTNYAPRTFNQLVALRPDLLMLNLSPREFSGWDLLERLHGEALTRHLPVVVTATNPAFLDHARRHSETYGESSLVALPFDRDALLGTIHALIGAAEPDRDPVASDEAAGGDRAP